MSIPIPVIKVKVTAPQMATQCIVQTRCLLSTESLLGAKWLIRSGNTLSTKPPVLSINPPRSLEYNQLPHPP